MTPLLDAERIFYTGAFGTGLLVAVYAMLHGSVRVGQDQTAAKAPSAAFNAPVLGAAFVAFGAVGYLLAKYSHLATITILFLSILAAAAGWTGMTVLMAKWALNGPIVDPHEEHEELQGTIATVIRDINKTSTGQIQYSFRGNPVKSEARSIDGEAVLAGTDVVIEKIENGVADVELWSVVEQRL